MVEKKKADERYSAHQPGFAASLKAAKKQVAPAKNDVKRKLRSVLVRWRADARARSRRIRLMTSAALAAERKS